MRKFLALALALIMIFSLAACKASVDTDDSSSNDTDPIVNPPETDDPENTGDETEDTSETSGIGDETEEPKGLSFTEVNETVYVYGTDVLNVRKEASADSEKMGEMKEGEQVTRVGYNAEWSKISYYGATYYASSDYLTTHAPLEFDDKTDTVYIIAEGSLNLRKKPAATPDSTIVANLPYGTKLDRIAIATTEDEFGTLWSKLLYNGEVCYASTIYLSDTKPAVLPTDDFKTVNETVYIVSAIGDRVVEALNLRATPSLSGNIVASVPAGTELIRVGIANAADEDDIVWSKVIYNNVICYASSGYLTTEVPEGVEPDTSVSQTFKNDYISFEYPKSWTKTDGAVIILVNSDGSGENITVSYEAKSDIYSTMTVSTFKSTLQPVYEAMGMTITNPSVKQRTRDGLNITDITYKATMSGNTMNQTMFVVTSGEYCYVVTHTTTGSSTDVADNIYDTLTVLK